MWAAPLAQRAATKQIEALAVAIVTFRATYLSGDLDDCWAFHVQKELHRLHSAGKWSVVEKQSHPNGLVTRAY